MYIIIYCFILHFQSYLTFSLQKAAANLLKDDRFSAMFKNPDFEVDTESQEYRLLNPVISKLDKDKKKKFEERNRTAQYDEIEVKILFQMTIYSENYNMIHVPKKLCMF